MIYRQAVFFWLALQLTVVTAGALGTLFGAPLGALLGALALVANGVVLQRAWTKRDDIAANKTLSDGLAATGLMAFLGLLFTMGLLPALSVLLVLIQLALASITNTYRQYYLLQLVSFVLLLSGAAEATSGGYLLVMLLFTLLAAFSLSEAWLDRGEHSAQFRGPGAAARLKVTAITVLIAVLVYMLVPRLSPLNWGGYQADSPDFYHNEQWQSQAQSAPPADNQKQRKSEVERTTPEGYDELNEITELSDADGDYSYAGFNEQFDIRDGERGGGVDLNAMVARMKADRGAYLKVRTFDTFDGIRWSSSSEDISRKLRTDDRGKVQLGKGEGDFLQVIEIVQPMPAWLPVAPDPATLWLPSSSVGLDQYGHPLLPATLTPGTRYSVRSTDVRYQGRPVSQAAAPDRYDVQLPQLFDTRIHRLARDVTQGADDAMAKAVALEQHLRTQYDYSFESILQSQGETPLDRFLFEDKRGHCEYFASAMAVMLRSIGIPARLITGFSATSQNPLTGYFEIRAIDGHAWTEAWIDGRWVTFEPTAYYDLPEPQSSPFAGEQIQQYAEDIARRQQAADGGWSLAGLLSSLWMLVYTLVTVVLALLKWLLLGLWPLWLLLALVSLVAYLLRPRWWPQARARWSQWKLQRYQPGDADASLRFYLFHLQRIGLLHGVERQPSQPADEWSQQLPSPSLQQLTASIGDYLYQQQPAPLAQWQQWAQQAAEQLIKR
ncbi:hypothetical protein CHH28_05605 [Bacterioplanes sanyensis]|uniref:Transglutaminase-like domain-containing protein n=1 Tax=Bacterioplanes sanyensis TaxID=1249553 RepID=A0A222FHR7_9GAMM|nr:DUF3488 and transglutaminase-like domain-containing protein [Bacterioplanes sanyensis]ASP38192.1 hypothetical protein CHH28_05605 [Bacterioplanes sanyensis]